jgi:activator of 2-hydroxyglutaryl-CoA dehydratase
VNPGALSATCAIFGESELIGFIVRGEQTERLAAGVNRVVVERVIPLLERMGTGIIVMSGGVALNKAVVGFLEGENGTPCRNSRSSLFKELSVAV